MNYEKCPSTKRKRNLIGWRGNGNGGMEVGGGAKFLLRDILLSEYCILQKFFLCRHIIGKPSG